MGRHVGLLFRVVLIAPIDQRRCHDRPSACATCSLRRRSSCGGSAGEVGRTAECLLNFRVRDLA